jgi:hypothetical protein
LLLLRWRRRLLPGVAAVLVVNEARLLGANEWVPLHVQVDGATAKKRLCYGIVEENILLCF